MTAWNLLFVWSLLREHTSTRQRRSITMLARNFHPILAGLILQAIHSQAQEVNWPQFRGATKGWQKTAISQKFGTRKEGSHGQMNYLVLDNPAPSFRKILFI